MVMISSAVVTKQNFPIGAKRKKWHASNTSHRPFLRCATSKLLIDLLHDGDELNSLLI